MRRAFMQVDVFTSEAYLGNPVAVVLDAEGLDTEAMQVFARWTNLSETTFVLPPTQPGADYAVRIFTPVAELPFAGHPTLGTCHAWLATGAGSPTGGRVVQECAAGLVTVRSTPDGLAFAAPPLVRSGPVAPSDLTTVARELGVKKSAIRDAQWVDNGPGWVAVELADAAAVLALTPRAITMDIGVVGFHPEGADALYEVRAFFPKDGVAVEDPVTGSLNASLAQWFIGTGRASAPYIATQGTALGRRGRAAISQDGDGTIWVGGGTVTCVSGSVEL
ncbi:MAG: PhzF family phenazine biosynthesis protein [Kineosporiaceae bacterium]|nr:PhzF family phenazine biosynthesis protein [Kineosporiaceae bacterium]